NRHYCFQRNAVRPQNDHRIKRESDCVEISRSDSSTTFNISLDFFQLDFDIIFFEISLLLGNVKRPITQPGNEADLQWTLALGASRSITCNEEETNGCY